MSINLLHQLEKRGVIRVAGIYGAFNWLLLQVSDVVFPLLNIPTSIIKYLLAFSFFCFPIILIFTWFYELTDQGIKREGEVEETGAVRLSFGSSATFISILSIALVISLFLNFTKPSNTPRIQPQLISVLIADFDNQTQEAIFDGAVEEALTIGIEGASFITSFNRRKALKISKKLNSTNLLTQEQAQLIAVREGIKLVLSGVISKKNSGYLLSLKAIEPRRGEPVASVKAKAKDKLGILLAVSSLASQLREKFGDVALDNNNDSLETFTTASLKAMQFYSQAQIQAQEGNREEAALLYEKATVEDQKFGRAYSGWALSEFQLGNRVKAESLWKKTLSLLDAMTEREKFRTLGLYYMRVSHNYLKAIENYQQLVTLYPADAVGRNNLAVAYFMERQFSSALLQGAAALEMYPKKVTLRSNYALYAMYAAKFDIAHKQATKLTKEKNVYYKAYLPLAMADIYSNKIATARQSYVSMALLGNRGESLAFSGLADLDMTIGQYHNAMIELDQGIDKDIANNSTYALATKYINRAQVLLYLNKKEAAFESVEQALEISQATAIKVSAALLYIELNQNDNASLIAKVFSEKLQKQDRAYAALIYGNIALSKGDTFKAVDAFRASIEKTDLWLTRLSLGKAYIKAKAYAEALSEFELCQKRIGEVTSLFLDDFPTYHHSVELFYWIGKSQHELDITDAAFKSLQLYISQTSESVKYKLVEDAKARLSVLSDKQLQSSNNS